MKVNDFIAFCLGVIVTVFTPIVNAIWVLTAMSFFDGLFGYLRARITDEREFSFRKAMRGIGHFAVFLTTVFMLHNVAMSFRDKELAEMGTKWLCYVVCYYYTLNIFKNVHKIYPSNKAIAFIYSFLSLDLLRMIMARFGLTDLKSIKENNNDKKSEKVDDDDHHQHHDL